MGKSIRHLAADAILAALEESNPGRIDALYVGNMISGEVAGQEHLGALIADFVGLRGVEAVKVEAACGSGRRGAHGIHGGGRRTVPISSSRRAWRR